MVSGTITQAQTYTVPAGKILLVDCLSSFGANYAEVGGGRMNFYNAAAITFPRPLKLSAGQQITNSFSSTSTVSYWGTLIDVADLYVAIPAKMNSISISNKSVVGKIAIDSKQPALVRIEKSQDLKSWITDTNAAVPPKGNLTNITFTTSKANVSNAFYRAKVLPN